MYLKDVLDSFGVDWSAENPDYSVIGLDNYPIFDEAYRPGLNQKIVEHYLNREIGLETPSLFKLNLGRKLREIMPYYNQLYGSEWAKLTQLDPFSTIKVDQLSTGTMSTTDSSTVNDTRNTNGTTAGSTTNAGRTVNSDFPQTALNGSGDYATSAIDAGGTGSSAGTSTTSEAGNQTASGTGSGSSSADTTSSGYQAHTAELLLRYRQTFLNIDMLVIEGDPMTAFNQRGLDELFMQVWDNGDEYTRRAGMWIY